MIDGVDVADMPPAKRGLSMVFQSYALYPHMSVRNNIAFGLKMAGVPKAEIDAQGRQGGAASSISPTISTASRASSRAASASASPSAAPSCAQPKAFLFDEPLSNLDAALRVQMRHRDHASCTRRSAPP